MGKQTFDKKRFPEAEVKALREQGLTSKELAKHYHCSTSTISVVLREYGLVKVRHIKTPEELNIKLEDTKVLMQRFEERLQKTAEDMQRRKQQLIQWQERKNVKLKKEIRHLQPDEIPSGYIY